HGAERCGCVRVRRPARRRPRRYRPPGCCVRHEDVCSVRSSSLRLLTHSSEWLLSSIPRRVNASASSRLPASGLLPEISELTALSSTTRWVSQLTRQATLRHLTAIE